MTLIFAALSAMAGIYFFGYYGAIAGILGYFILRTGFTFTKVLVVTVGGYLLTMALLNSGMGEEIMPVVGAIFLLLLFFGIVGLIGKMR